MVVSDINVTTTMPDDVTSGSFYAQILAGPVEVMNAQ
jgi:hypothetical protein